mmetsp:Transcript_948/g.3124  ORF Transcript_948/g.3124 Transcript_948/m.3124 type:complete len:268 (-) Transcript_948:32-835(-)
MEAADQQRDEVARRPRERNKMVDLVHLFAELQPELAGIQGVDDNLGVIRGVWGQHFAALAVRTWVHDLDVILRDVDLQVARVRVVLVPVVADWEPARPGGDQVLQAHLGDGVELEGAQDAIGVAVRTTIGRLRLADNVHADVVRRGVVHAAVDPRNLNQVGTDAALPTTADGNGLAAVGPRCGRGYEDASLAKAPALAPRLEVQGEVVVGGSRDPPAHVGGPIAGGVDLPQDLLGQASEGLGDGLQGHALAGAEQAPERLHRARRSP